MMLRDRADPSPNSLQKLFKAVVDFRGVAEKTITGRRDLKPNQDYHGLHETFSKGNTCQVRTRRFETQ